MAANTQPIFLDTPILWTATLTSEVVNRSPGSAVPKLLGTGGANGSLIETIRAYPLGDNVVSVIRVFGGSGYTLLAEATLPVVTSSGNVSAIANYPIEITLNKILSPASCDANTPNRAFRLPAGYSLYVALGTAIASGVIVVAAGGNY